MRPSALPLTVLEKNLLLHLARRSIRRAVEGAGSLEAPGDHPRLAIPQGVFVTLLMRGRLRGCVGVLEATGPLWEAVVHCAAAAAREDPRFPPLEPSEIEAVQIEVTVLQSPFQPRGPEDIVLGRHGLMVRRGGQRGVLLPRVAVEHGFDVPGFIRETLRKAGLPADALQNGGASLWIFEAESFTD